MQDTEIQQLFEHHVGAEPSTDKILAFGRDIERRERAACATEIHEGHHEFCVGKNCDCQHLHRLIRARTDKQVREHTLNKIKQQAILDERNKCIEIAQEVLAEGEFASAVDAVREIVDKIRARD